MKKIKFVFLISVFSTGSFSAENSDVVGKEAAEEKQQKKPAVIQETVLGMNVSGNKELPNVLYIVPWKASASFAKPPAATRLVEEIYAPVDPHAFGKKVMFYKQLTSDNKKEKQD